MTITPEQIRNTAKSGQQMRAETLLEIADRLEAVEATKGAVMNEELIKRLQDEIIKTICTGLPGPNACRAPDCECYEGNGKPVFNAIAPLFFALTQQSQEPVAWWRFDGHYTDKFEKGWFQRHKPECNGVPLYIAPQPGVHEGMRQKTLDALAAIEANLGWPGSDNALALIQAHREVITRAADQVNAEDYSKVPMGPVGATYIGDTILPAPQSSQPDTVATHADVETQWTLRSPDGRMFFGESPLAVLRKERNSRMSAAEQLENIRKGMEEAESQPDTVAVPRDYKELYLDLIMQVGNCHPGESRHDTAKRYIVNAEACGDDRAAQEGKK